jgi:hypothetical protein
VPPAGYSRHLHCGQSGNASDGSARGCALPTDNKSPSCSFLFPAFGSHVCEQFLLRFHSIASTQRSLPRTTPGANVFGAGDRERDERERHGPDAVGLKDEGNVTGGQSISDQKGGLAPQIDVEDRSVRLRRTDDLRRGVDASRWPKHLSSRGGNLTREIQGDDGFVPRQSGRACRSVSWFDYPFTLVVFIRSTSGKQACRGGAPWKSLYIDKRGSPARSRLRSVRARRSCRWTVGKSQADRSLFLAVGSHVCEHFLISSHSFASAPAFDTTSTHSLTPDTLLGWAGVQLL